MSRIHLVGESWFTYSVHQKGFDAFYTSEYVEGGQEFVAALTSLGHDVVRTSSHSIESSFPTTAAELRDRTDVLVLSDIGANSLQISRSTFGSSVTDIDRAEVIREYVEDGGGLLAVGGYMSFSGVDAKARWGRSPLRLALPVEVLDRDDRIELAAGETPFLGSPHDVTQGLDAKWPPLLGLNEVTARPGSTVAATCAGYPLLVLGEYGAGRTAAFASDLAPHWAPPAFMAWPGYARLFGQLVEWLHPRSWIDR